VGGVKPLRIPPELVLLFLILGVFLVFAGAVLLSISFVPAGRAWGGGLIIIGPFPIILHGKLHPAILLLILIIPLLVFILLTLYLLGRARSGEEAG